MSQNIWERAVGLTDQLPRVRELELGVEQSGCSRGSLNKSMANREIRPQKGQLLGLAFRAKLYTAAFIVVL